MKTKQLTIDDVIYEVKEPTVGTLFPIMELMESNPKQFQMELVKGSVYINGQSIGDNVNNLTIATYLKLMEAVLEVSGLGVSSGND